MPDNQTRLFTATQIRVAQVSGISGTVILHTYLCLTDGAWGSWDTWSQCSAECGTGTRTRSRRCDSPEPTAGGNDCEGESDENENCNFHTCIGNHGCSCCCMFVCLFVCLFVYVSYL